MAMFDYQMVIKHSPSVRKCFKVTCSITNSRSLSPKNGSIKHLKSVTLENLVYIGGIQGSNRFLIDDT